jgi:HAD superfamily hydrolase (TIGR01458 family)
VDALLLDLDGTLYVGDSPLPGAVEAVASLVERGVPRRYLTNTTRYSRRTLAERLRSMGFPIALEEIFNAATAARRWLREREMTRVSLYLPEAALEDFAELEIVEERPDAVVIGDLAGGWSFERLNGAFRQVLDGAALVALQKNRYWRTSDGLTLDAGPFVAALEYATGRSAVVTGKPSRAFFQLAADSLGLAPARIGVVGDDVETDVAGAQAAGMRGVLVRTGKFREAALAESGITPDRLVASLGELVEEVLAGSVEPERS